MSLARWPPRFAYQVWLWTRSASPTAAAIARSIESVCERRRVRRVTRERVPGAVGDGARHEVAGPVGAPAVHRELDEPRQLAREVLDVDARAAVHVGRVLPREQRDPQRVDHLALADHDDAALGDDEALAVGLGSTPICAPAATSTFLSRIALRTTALRPTSTPCMQHRALDLRVRVHVDARREDRAAHAAARDDHAGADHRVDRLSRCGPPPRTRTSPAAAARPGEDRPRLVVEVEDGHRRDQVHVRVVVGVERPDVAPVAALALARARDVVREKS